MDIPDVYTRWIPIPQYNSNSRSSGTPCRGGGGGEIGYQVADTGPTILHFRLL